MSGWWSRWYARRMEAWAGVGVGRCAYCRREMDRATTVGAGYCSEKCADDGWASANS